ncbi:MAG: MerR family transcriptional regulator [Dehalococcoidia bacterium]|nr:MerR family transcriptional regulator [Dehalococcoidia bacterium]
MSFRNPSDPVYSIRVAARLVGLHVQTLRYYERNGLVQPQRSRGNVRYYSDSDVERIQKIKSLIDELGVNLAGAEVIMRMSGRMAEMEQRIKDLEGAIERLTGVRALADGSADNAQPQRIKRNESEETQS